MSRSDVYYMKHALYWARKAEALGEAPIGAVLVRADRIIAHGYNRRESRQDVTEHAELMALREASRRLNSWRLDNSTLYVTLEPCFMCAAAIQQARVARVCFGTPDPKAGALVSQAHFFEDYRLNHTVYYQEGVLADCCAEIIHGFFRRLRAADKCLEADVGGRGARRRLMREEGGVTPSCDRRL